MTRLEMEQELAGRLVRLRFGARGKVTDFQGKSSEEVLNETLDRVFVMAAGTATATGKAIATAEVIGTGRRTTIRLALLRGSAPPSGLAFLLACVARRGRADEVLGDAEEEYRKMVARLGPVWARWHYRVYVLRISIGMLPGVMARVALLHKLLGLMGL